MKNSVIPDSVHFGPDSVDELPELLRKSGTKVLLVHGHRPVEDGLLVKIRLILNQAGFPHADLGQILPNPKYDSVKRGIKKARKEHCDIVLSLGGGSTLQCAKAIALGMGYKGDVWDFWTGKKTPKKVYPIGAILTIPSSGAELSDSCTIVRKGERKTIRLEKLVCSFAVLDPKLSLYPLYPTMNQVFTIFQHLFFAALEKEGRPHEDALSLMQDLTACSKALKENINDVEARTELYRIGLLTHIQTGKVTENFKDLASSLAFAFSLPDGSAESALFGAWLDAMHESRQQKAEGILRQVFAGNAESAAGTPSGWQMMSAWLQDLNLPKNLEQAGLELSRKRLLAIAKDDLQKQVLTAAAHASKKAAEQTGQKS